MVFRNQPRPPLAIPHFSNLAFEDGKTIPILRNPLNPRLACGIIPIPLPYDFLRVLRVVCIYHSNLLGNFSLGTRRAEADCSHPLRSGHSRGILVIQKKYGFFLLHPSMKNTSSPLLYEDARRISSNVQYFPQKTELLGNPRALYILLNDNFVSHYGADFPGTEAHGITLHLFLDSLDSVVFSAADG